MIKKGARDDVLVHDLWLGIDCINQLLQIGKHVAPNRSLERLILKLWQPMDNPMVNALNHPNVLAKSLTVDRELAEAECMQNTRDADL